MPLRLGVSAALCVLALAVVAALALPPRAGAWYGQHPQTSQSSWTATYNLVKGSPSVAGESAAVRQAVGLAAIDAGAVPKIGVNILSIPLGSGSLYVGYRFSTALTYWFSISCHPAADCGDTTHFTKSGYTAWGTAWVYRASSHYDSQIATAAGIDCSAGCMFYSTQVSGIANVTRWSCNSACAARFALRDAMNGTDQGVFHDGSSGGDGYMYRAQPFPAFKANSVIIGQPQPYTSQAPVTASYSTVNIPAQPAWGSGTQQTISTDLMSGVYATDIRIGQLIDPTWEGLLDDEVLLEQFAPELRLDIHETYAPANAALATDTYVSDESGHSNRLVPVTASMGPIAYADADPAHQTEQLDVLSLGYLETWDTDQVKLSYANSEGSQRVSSALDYGIMLDRDYSKYANKMYGRVVHAASNQIFVQYWFYYYDNPNNVAGIGVHQGDWETVTYELDPTGGLLGATYAQHSREERCGWDDVPLTQDEHPIVWVATDSHASYFWPGSHPNTETSAAPDDETAEDDPDDYRAFRPQVIPVEDVPALTSYGGLWGVDEGVFVATTLVGASPKSPGFQSAWDVETWVDDAEISCTSPSALRARTAGGVTPKDAEPGQGEASTQDATTSLGVRVPPLPVASALRYRDRLEVHYCFKLLPTNYREQRWRLSVSVDGLNDKLTPITLGWPVKARCGLIRQPLGVLRPPLTVEIRTTAVIGRSQWKSIPIRTA